MRCLIVDDQDLGRKHLRDLLSVDPTVEIVAEVASGSAALEVASQSGPDIAFVDVELPSPGGLEVARALLALLHPPSVVFLSEHSDYSLEAYDLGVIDYLLKPLCGDRLRRTLERVRDRCGVPPVNGEQAVDRVLLSHPVTQVQEIVLLEEIGWFTANGDQVWAVVRGEKFRVSQSLAKLEAKLHSQQFLRIHKAYLVNLRKVHRLICLSRRHHVLRTFCGEELPLSRHYLDSFRAKVPGL